MEPTDSADRVRVHDVITRRGLLKRLAFAAGGMAAIGAGLVPIESLASSLMSSGASWRRLTPAQSPGSRAYSAMTFDESHDIVMLFGGLGAEDDTWLFDGSDWTQSRERGPASRYGASLAFDPLSRAVLMFGGLSVTGFLGDTWLWQGSKWQRLDLQSQPAPRVGAAIALDPGSNRLVLFGGLSDRAVLGDTWTWSGSAWQEAAPTSAPRPSAGAFLGYDPSSQRLLLSGGAQSSMGVPADKTTWRWTGSSWSRAAGPVPAQTMFGASAGSRSLNSQAAFGGLSEGAFSDDVWVNTGGAVHQTRSSGPGARAYASMAFEPRSRGLLLFGGQNADGFLGDTWLLSL